MNLLEIERKSDERAERLMAEARQKEIQEFNASTDRGLEVMPYKDAEMIFRQQDRRVSWGKHGARYVSARHYPNADCARQVIDELVRRGCKNAMKEGETE